MSRCVECGASYSADSDSCTLRFEQLLALDHSRREPWGSRHGQAFAAFALQHPLRYSASLDRAWQALARIYLLGEAPAHVFASLRVDGRATTGSSIVPPRPTTAVRAPTVTIADLGDFAADEYAAALDAWCRATLHAWGADVPPLGAT
jgi:hypothetical protein